MPKTWIQQHSAVFHNAQPQSNCVSEQQCIIDSVHLEAPELTHHPLTSSQCNCKGPQQPPKDFVLLSDCYFNNSLQQLFLFLSFILDLTFNFTEWDPMFSWYENSRNKHTAHALINCLQALHQLPFLLASVVPPLQNRQDKALYDKVVSFIRPNFTVWYFFTRPISTQSSFLF